MPLQTFGEARDIDLRKNLLARRREGTDDKEDSAVDCFDVEALLAGDIGYHPLVIVCCVCEPPLHAAHRRTSNLRQINRNGLPAISDGCAPIEANVFLGASNPHRLADRTHGVLPARIIDIEPQKHEDLRPIDLPFLLGIEGLGNDGADLRPTVGRPLHEAFVEQFLGDLQLRTEVDEVRNLDLYFHETIKGLVGAIALGAADLGAVLLGEEVAGIASELLAACDDIIEIPMHGQKESFNVSVAAGIALYALRQQSLNCQFSD
jgi:hypothetical protein